MFLPCLQLVNGEDSFNRVRFIYVPLLMHSPNKIENGKPNLCYLYVYSIHDFIHVCKTLNSMDGNWNRGAYDISSFVSLNQMLDMASNSVFFQIFLRNQGAKKKKNHLFCCMWTLTDFNYQTASLFTVVFMHFNHIFVSFIFGIHSK